MDTKKLAIAVGILSGVAALMFVISKVAKKAKPVDVVVKKGAKPFSTPSGQQGFEFGDYQFYANNRAMQKSTKKMGSYSNKEIFWDKGGETSFAEIFKK